MSDNKFTLYLKTIRLFDRYSLRGAAEGMGVSAPFLHDLENGERKPTRKMIGKIIDFYNLDEENQRILYDLAAESLDTLPFDVIDFLKENNDVLQDVINTMNEKKLQKIKR
jgi:transcriptional regulator with XRE-family HTH domain